MKYPIEIPISIYRIRIFSSIISNFIVILVGGGTAFSTSPAAGGFQTFAAGLVPAGLTPVAFFPPTPNQQLQALSVIFLELPVKKRKRRSLKGDRGDLLFNFYHPYVIRNLL